MAELPTSQSKTRRLHSGGTREKWRRSHHIKLGLLTALAAGLKTSVVGANPASMHVGGQTSRNYLETMMNSQSTSKRCESTADVYLPTNGKVTAGPPTFPLDQEYPITSYVCEQLSGPSSVDLCAPLVEGASASFDTTKGLITLSGDQLHAQILTGTYQLRIQPIILDQEIHEGCLYTVNVYEACTAATYMLIATPEVHATSFTVGHPEQLLFSWNLAQLLSPLPEDDCAKTLRTRFDVSKNGAQFEPIDSGNDFRVNQKEGKVFVVAASVGSYTFRFQIVDSLTGESVTELSKNFPTLRVVSDVQEAAMIETEHDFDQNSNTEKHNTRKLASVCIITVDECLSSYTYGYDHTIGQETVIAPKYSYSAECDSQRTYVCTQTSAGKTSDLCTKNDPDWSIFDIMTGELMMQSIYAKRHVPGTYDITFQVNDGTDGIATCSTQVILTDPCQDPAATFSLNSGPNPVMADTTIQIGDENTKVLGWTWPQVVTQSVQSHIRCALTLVLQVSKDYGSDVAVSESDLDVWSFSNEDLYLKKQATGNDASQVGEYSFKYSVLKQWDNQVITGGTVDNAFKVIVGGPACYPKLTWPTFDYNWENFYYYAKTFQSTFAIEGSGCALLTNSPYSCTTLVSPDGSTDLCQNVGTFDDQACSLKIHGSNGEETEPMNVGIPFGTYTVQFKATADNNYFAINTFDVNIVDECASLLSISFNNDPFASEMIYYLGQADQTITYVVKDLVTTVPADSKCYLELIFWEGLSQSAYAEGIQSGYFYAPIQFGSPTRTLTKFSSTTASEVGSYFFNLEVRTYDRSITTIPSETKAFVWKVEASNCVASFNNCQPTTHDYTSDPSWTPSLTIVPQQDAICFPQSYACSLEDNIGQVISCNLPGKYSFDSNTGKMSFDNPYTPGDLNSGVNQLTFTVTMSTGSTATCTRQFTIVNLCETANVNLTGTMPYANQVYTMYQDAVVMQEISNSVTVDQHNCGALIWRIEFYKDGETPLMNWVQLPQSNLEKGWNSDSTSLTKRKSTDDTEIGIYYIRYKYSLASYPSQESAFTTEYFTWTVLHGCANTLITPNDIMYDYYVGDPPLSVVFPAGEISVTLAQCGPKVALPPKFNPDYFSFGDGQAVIQFEVGSWKTQPLTTIAPHTAAGALSRRFLAQADPTATLATEAYVSNYYLRDYPDVTASFSIIFNIKGCQVSEADVIIPKYSQTQVIDLDEENFSDILFSLTPFESKQADTCGFKWFYSIQFNAEFDLGAFSQDDFVELTNDQSQLIFKAPKSSIAQNGTLTVTGQLATHTGVIQKQVQIEVAYQKASIVNSELPNELTKLDSIINQEPFFESPLLKKYVFDIAPNASNSLSVSLGRVIDHENNTLVFKNNQGGAQEAFLKLESENDSNEFTISVNRAEAAVGNYTLQLKINEEVNAAIRSSSIFIKVEIINSDLQVEAETETETETASTADVANDEKNPINRQAEPDKAKEAEEVIVVNPAYIITVARIPAWDKAPALRSLPQILKDLNAGIRSPYITKVSNTGKIEINFSSRRYTEEKDLSPTELLQLSQQSRSLQADISDNGKENFELEDSLNAEEIIYGALDKNSTDIAGVTVYLQASDMQDKNLLQFTYKVDEFTDTKLVYSLQFDNPLVVSSTIQKDQVVIQMRNFRDADNKLIAEDQDIRQDIPNQIDSEAALTIAQAGTVASTSVGASVSLNIVLNIVMKSSMNQMLSSIKNLQVIVHLCLLSVIMPANSQIFFEYLFEMIAFDPVDVDEYINGMFGLKDDDFGLKDAFVQLGYESAFFVTNMGSLLFILAFQIVLIPIQYTMYRSMCCHKRVRKYASNSLDSCFFNGVLAFIDGTFLVLIITGFINSDRVFKGDLPFNTSFWLALFTLIICIVEIGAVSYFFVTRFKSLDEDRNKKRCGFIYEDLSYRVQGGRALLYPMFYQVRFIVLGGITVFLHEKLVLQVEIVTLSTISIMVLIGYAHPFSQVSRNYTSLLNEFVILIIMDLLLFASDPSLDLDQRILIGYGIIGILGTSIFLGQGSILCTQLKGLCHKCKLKQLRKKNIKLMNARQLEKLDAAHDDCPLSQTEANKAKRLQINSRIGATLPLESIQEESERSSNLNDEPSSNNIDLLGNSSINDSQQKILYKRRIAYMDASIIDSRSIDLSADSPQRSSRRIKLLPQAQLAKSRVDNRRNLSQMIDTSGSSSQAAQMTSTMNPLQELIDKKRNQVENVKSNCIGCNLRGYQCVLCEIKDKIGDDVLLDISSSEADEEDHQSPRSRKRSNLKLLGQSSNEY